MQNVSIGEVRLAYEEVGKGAPLIQVHGAGFGHHNFATVTPIPGLVLEHFETPSPTTWNSVKRVARAVQSVPPSAVAYAARMRSPWS